MTTTILVWWYLVRQQWEEGGDAMEETKSAGRSERFSLSKCISFSSSNPAAGAHQVLPEEAAGDHDQDR
jgi:hypothetical protein